MRAVVTFCSNFAQVKSKLLEKTLDEFTRTTTDLSRLSHDMSLRQIDAFGRVESVSEGFWSKHLDEYTSTHAKPTKDVILSKSDSAPDSEVEELQVEFGRLCREEMHHREVHRIKCAELQDIWNKLVALRAHMTSFRAGIEEMTLEEIHEQASHSNPRESASSADVSRSYYELLELGTDEASQAVYNSPMRVSHTAAAADRLVDMHILKEKVRNRDALRHKSHLQQQRLDELRQKIDVASEELSQAAQLGDRVPRALQRAMQCREHMLSLSQLLEDEEQSFLRINQELLTIESEVSQALENEASNATLRSDNVLATSSVNLPVADRRGSTFSSDVVKCEFSLDEVLLGKAKISRMNGESASQYRIRLQKRLASVTVLATQLQEEVDEKAKVVKHAQDALKEAEVRRLRHELQIANICGVLHRKRLEARAAAASVHGGYDAEGPSFVEADVHQYRNGQLSGRELLSKLLQSDTKSETSDDVSKSLPSSWLESALGYRPDTNGSAGTEASHAPSRSKPNLSRKSSHIDEAVDLLLSTPAIETSPEQPPPLTLADLDAKLSSPPPPNTAMTPLALQQNDEKSHTLPREHRKPQQRCGSPRLSRSPSPVPDRRQWSRRNRRKHRSYSSSSWSSSSDDDTSSSSSFSSSNRRHRRHRRHRSHRSPSLRRNDRKDSKQRHRDREKDGRGADEKSAVIGELASSIPTKNDDDTGKAVNTASTHSDEQGHNNIATQLQQLINALSVQDEASVAAVKSSLLQILDMSDVPAPVSTPAKRESSPLHRIRRSDSPVHDMAYYYSAKKQPFHRIEARFAQRSASGAGEAPGCRYMRSRSPPRRANTAPAVPHAVHETPNSITSLLPSAPSDGSPKSKWVSATEGQTQIAYSKLNASESVPIPPPQEQRPVESPMSSPLRLLREKKRLDIKSSDSVNSSSLSDSSSTKSTSISSNHGDASEWLVEEIVQPHPLLVRGSNAKDQLTSQLCKCLESLNDAKLQRRRGIYQICITIL